jgi:hypothetical protein
MYFYKRSTTLVLGVRQERGPFVWTHTSLPRQLNSNEKNLHQEKIFDDVCDTYIIIMNQKMSSSDTVLVLY